MEMIVAGEQSSAAKSLRWNMVINARFVHTNLIAQDWKRLARFYEQVFGCTPIPPERNLAGQWLEEGTGVPNAQIRGMHLRFPGYGDEGPTLEIFQYNHQEERPKTAINRPGFAHIAFAVDDVESARDAVIAAGGGVVGEVVSVQVSGAGRVTFVYLTDPEGNIIELQSWS
jgi:predicted enzyme related to lactoylglutathione lyase